MNLDQIDALTGVTRHLAELHRASVGFNPPPVLDGIRQDWGDWEEKWQYRLDELYRLGEEAQHHKGDFEHLFLKVLDDFIQDGVRSLEKLKALDIRSIIDAEKLRGGLCQRDYKPGNLLENQDGYRLLDFDDFAGQSHLEDIARFIKEVGDWDPEKIQYIFNVYSEVYQISEPEKEAILAYLKLPLDLWKVARNHYLRDKPQKQNLKKVVQEMNRRKRCFGYLESPKRMIMAVNPATWTWDLPAEKPLGTSIDEYWNRWNWGSNWQAAEEPLQNTKLHQYSYEPEHYSQVSELVGESSAEVFNDQELEEAVPAPIFEETTEVRKEPVMEEPFSMEMETEPELAAIMAGPEGLSENGPVVEENTIEVQDTTEPIAKEVIETSPVTTPAQTPKVAVWKAFPKPIGK